MDWSGILCGSEDGMTEYFQIKDGVLEAYTGREELLWVPEGVHTIGEGAFKGCVSLKKVVLPVGLERILAGAFKGCRKLEEVEIPEGVSYIGAYAFHRCHALKRVILPLSVGEVGDCAFLYCDGLTEVRMPGTKRLGTQAFANDVSLERLEICRELEEDRICDVFTGCGRVREISFPDGECCRMPNVVEVMAEKLPVPPLIHLIVSDILRMMELEGRCLIRFRVNIKHVEVPEGIESLARSCFYDMRGILSVKLPESLKSIGSRAFRNCIGLEKVIFGGESVRIHEDAFRNCTSLKIVRLRDGREYVFTGIADLTEAGVPEVVRTVQKQVLGNFRISGTLLLKYLGEESRVVVPEGITRIAGEAFAGKENIDKMILPESLREIGAEAFRDCLLLQTISIPKGLWRIGEGAFENCVKLLRFSFPEGICEIKARTFRNCKALQEVEFSKGLQMIGESAFYGCGALKRVQFPEGLSLIGELAFYRCSGLREVRLPMRADQVKSLAFAKSGVRRVWISGGDPCCKKGRQYGAEVFGDCVQLKTLVLEEGVCHIPDKLAYGCTALERVVLPKTLETVGRHAFEGTPFLEKWVRGQAERSESDSQESSASSFASANVAERLEADVPEGIVFWDGRHLKGKVRLPNQVQIVAGGAFYGNAEVTEIYLPEKACSVGEAAFKGCRRLRRIGLPEGNTGVEAEVFSGCEELEEIFLSVHEGQTTPFGQGKLLTSGKDDDKSQEKPPASGKDGDKSQGNAPSLWEQLSLSGEDTDRLLPVWHRIGERAFYQCRKLRRVRLEEVESIGKEAFAGCAVLEEARVSPRLKIGERAFEGTPFLRGKENGLCIVGNIVVSGESCSGEVCLPEGLVGIAPYAFAGNRSLCHVKLPESLQWIGEGAFLGCSGLAQVRFPEGLRRIESRAFEKCMSLQEVRCWARQIGSSAFAGCISLTRAVLSGVTRLGERLFEGCKSLEECVCEEARAVMAFCFSGCRRLSKFSFRRLLVVRSYAFDGCESLKCAEFPDGACLGPRSLGDCSGLERVVLSGPQGELQLREYALAGCTALRWVVFQGREWEFCHYGDLLSERIPEAVRLLFYSAFSCFTVEQEENLSAYCGTAHTVRIPQGIRRIEAEVFRDVTMLEQVEIPESVEFIGARAFHGTAWMERRRRESPLVMVRDMLLDGSGCAGEVVIPGNIRLVCGWAFANGLEIERICFLPERVQVGEYAFRNCISLREMRLPDGLEIRFTGLGDRERELPPLAKQAVMDSLNCFKTDEGGVLMECTGNISRLRLVYGITAVGEGAFQDGNLLSEIVFSETVKRIGKRGFAGCKWLEEVRQALGVEEIGEGAFSGCGVLRRVELSEKFQRMGARAFENCTSLEEIRIPEGVEEIPARAFYRCHSLREIRIPSTVKRIGREAFAFCRGLEEVSLPEGVLVEERAFCGVAAGALENLPDLPWGEV